VSAGFSQISDTPEPDGVAMVVGLVANAVQQKYRFGDDIANFDTRVISKSNSTILTELKT
jgi:hypothetical protein